MEEYREAIQYLEFERPEHRFLDAQDGLEWERFDYFPEAHFSRALNQALKDEFEDELLPDGGSLTKYYWRGGQGVLYHTEVGDGMVDPFFDSVEQAEHYLQRLADDRGVEQYEGLVLRKSGNRKVEEAVDVLTDQSGLTDW